MHEIHFSPQFLLTGKLLREDTVVLCVPFVLSQEQAGFALLTCEKFALRAPLRPQLTLISTALDCSLRAAALHQACPSFIEARRCLAIHTCLEPFLSRRPGDSFFFFFNVYKCLPASMSANPVSAWCLPSPKEVLSHLELELQMSVSCHVGAGELNPSPLEEQPELLTTEPFLQPYIVVS